MTKKVITDEDILGDLEYNGVPRFIIDMECGFTVPSNLAGRVMRIVREAYGIDLDVVSRSSQRQSGHFCLIPYTNETMSELKK